MYIEWKNPLCPKTKFIIPEISLFFFPILDLVLSISGKIEKNTAIKIKNNLFWMLKKINDNNAVKSPNARWV